jgi:hypothetical protein
MTPDPRWLELLKASGWQTAALAIACAAFLGAARFGWLPPLEPWIVVLTWFALFVCGSLALTSLLSEVVAQIRKWIVDFKAHRALLHFIETLNPGEVAFLKEQIGKGAVTWYLNPFSTGSIPNFAQQASLYQALQYKDIVDVTPVDSAGKILAVTIRENAWRLLSKKFRE